ncbi:MAG TPA: Gfo/Idh/MocA family oxidoreductase [Planctomycetota bacterium]|nr:Gfo/Idh/MocA family oxidoreductase [Planctomycetota bacterium]
MGLRVAVLGASGFGRHHAKWYAELGCDVVAFLGSSPDTVEATARALRDAIGFRGRGYTSLDTLLAGEQPDAVSVCTPPALHGEHALAAIEAGCAVLCEKPFVWRPGAPAATLVAEAARLVRAADRKQAVLAVNTQYAAAAEEYRQLAPQAAQAPSRFFGEMTSLRKPDGPRGRDIVVDLLPHPLSVLLALVPGAELRPGTVRAAIGHEATQAQFQVAAGGRTCAVTLHVAKLPAPPFPRRFGLNDQIAEVGTRPDGQGVYRGTVRLGDRERLCDDFMKTSVARFCRAVRGEGPPLVAGRAALRNLELLLATLDEAERTPRRTGTPASTPRLADETKG